MQTEQVVELDCTTYGERILLSLFRLPTMCAVANDWQRKPRPRPAA